MSFQKTTWCMHGHGSMQRPQTTKDNACRCTSRKRQWCCMKIKACDVQRLHHLKHKMYQISYKQCVRVSIRCRLLLWNMCCSVFRLLALCCRLLCVRVVRNRFMFSSLAVPFPCVKSSCFVRVEFNKHRSQIYILHIKNNLSRKVLGRNNLDIQK